ncbi:MAG: DUF433 domain-containing protein [Clostridiales Family XIII bacterium]|jgi:uncharacterized protein (DUF433 family)|nr:DUF433 domain-containing protein [Clostridiales Family XIII bacterium]
MERFDRITLKPDVMGGKACIKGTRVTVGMIMSHLAEGVSFDELLASFPYISREDIAEALRYAAWLSDARELDFECA